MNRLAKVLPHLSIILGIMLISLNVADYFNGSMGFLSGDAAKVVMLALSLTAILNAAVLIGLQRHLTETPRRAGSEHADEV